MLNYLPPWLARPAAALALAGALTGSAFVFWAAYAGDYGWAIWGGVAFLGSALLWYLGDIVATSQAPGPG